MAKSLFITATGTDVGKTYISALLVKKMRVAGMNCGYYKPVLSGAEEVNSRLVPGDCDYVVKTAGLDNTECASYVFKNAFSPHLAAEIEQKSINLDKIRSDFARISKNYDYLVVEGAGGIVCPLNLTESRILLTDLIKTLNLDILVVANTALGTINYTVLTAEYARLHGITIRGIILNRFDETSLMHRDNKQRIEELTGIPVLATVKPDENELNIDIERLL